MAYLRESVRAVLASIVIPLYDYALAQQTVVDAWPKVELIAYYDTYSNPAELSTLAARMLELISATMQAEVVGGGAGMGRHLQNGTWLESIERSVADLERVATMFDALPVREPLVSEEISKLRIKIMGYKASLRLISGIKGRDTSKKVEVPSLGLLSAAARILAEASLQAHCALNHIEVPVPKH